MHKEQIKRDIESLVKEYFGLTKQEFIPGESRIGVAFPCYDHNEVVSAIGSLLDLRLSQGQKVREFEEQFSNYIGTRFGIAVNSGSSANLLAISSMLTCGIIKKGSEVIVPAATFATVVSPLLQNGLVPVFVDVDLDTYNISPDEVNQAINEHTSLIMPVHSLGCPANIEKIIRIADSHKIPVLEDCCEAHGTSLNGRKVGSFGFMSAYSFFVAHNITTGEGGMILTNDEELNKLIRSMREFGRLAPPELKTPRFSYTDEILTNYDERYVFKTIGYNVRMSDIHASLGIEQLKKLDLLNRIRAETAEFFSSSLSQFHEYLKLPSIPKGAFHSFYTYPILVKENKLFSRLDLVRFLEYHGIETRAFMGGNLALQPAFRNEKIRIASNLENSNNILNNAFFIGCHPCMTQEQREYVVSVFEAFFKTE